MHTRTQPLLPWVRVLWRNIFKFMLDRIGKLWYNTLCKIHKRFAAVAEQADATDLKSVEGNLVPVRFRSAAPPEQMATCYVRLADLKAEYPQVVEWQTRQT